MWRLPEGRRPFIWKEKHMKENMNQVPPRTVTSSELLQMMQELPEDVILRVEIEQKREGEEDGGEIQTG